MRKLQRGVEPLWPVWKAGASSRSATGAETREPYPPPESRTPLCWVKSPAASRANACEEKRIARSAREESNLRASAAYQAGCLNQDSATGGRGRTSGGAGSNRLLGVHNPALCRVSYAPGMVGSNRCARLRGGRSATLHAQQLRCSTAGGIRTLTGTPWPTTF